MKHPRMKNKKTSKPRKLHIHKNITADVIQLLENSDADDTDTDDTAYNYIQFFLFKSPNFRVKKNYGFVAFLIVFHENLRD